MRAGLSAFVLHHWSWSESSLILDLFTREQGRLVAVARGAKKPHSNLRAVLLPLQRITVTLGKAAGEGDVHPLRTAEWAGGGAMPSGSALFSGFYANELVMKLLARGDPHPRLWDAYARLAARLPLAEAAALRAFELELLQETGVLPDLAAESLTLAELQPRLAYALRPEAGLARADDGGVPSGDWLRLRDALAANDRDALEATCAQHAAPLKAMLRTVLHYHLGTSTLRTREVLRSLQSLA